MANLTLFWGERTDPSFVWMSEQANSDGAVSSCYEISSKNLLKADLSCLADMLAGDSVTLILSSVDIVSAQVTVPQKAQKLLRKAIPYILEDEIATPVEELFFAFSQKNKEGLLPVRAIAKDYIEELIAFFMSAELKLENILVELDLLEKPDQGLSLLLSGSECLIAETDDKRWHCFSDDFSWLVQKQFVQKEKSASSGCGSSKSGSDKKKSDDEIMPIALPLDIYSSEPTDQFEHKLPVGRFAVETHLLENKEEFLFKNISNDNKAVNLLQAEYEPKRENSQLTSFLLRVASIVGFVLLTHIIYQSVSLYSLSNKNDQLEAQKLTLYKQAFPTRKIPSSAGRAVKSMRSHVRSLGGASGDGDFLSLLNSSSEKLTDLTKIYPTNINYDSARNELRMDLIASDLVVLDKYADELRNSGHKVSKSSETQTGDGYSSRLTINR
ncbi:MAG: type II secretion system protein GspL [Kangiellaceae bacterium]|nr:type II secretion system protein GspL [Kangiellaceae bacterium]